MLGDVTPNGLAFQKGIRRSTGVTDLVYCKITANTDESINIFDVVVSTGFRPTYFKIMHGTHNNFRKSMVLQAYIPSGNNQAERITIYNNGLSLYVPFIAGITITGLFGYNYTIEQVSTYSGTALSQGNYVVVNTTD